MVLNKRAKIFSVTGIIVIIASIAVFLLLQRGWVLPHTWLGFGFVLYSEMILFGGLTAIECVADRCEHIIIRSGGGIVLVVYSVLTLIISLIYMSLPLAGFRGFWIVQIILFSIAAILELVIYTSAQSQKIVNRKSISALARINEIADRLGLLKQNEDYEKQIAKLVEDLKFTDISTTVEADGEIEAAIGKLELEFAKDKPEQDIIDGLLKQMGLLIKKRKAQVRSMKVGGI